MWRATLWTGMEKLMDKIYSCCGKVRVCPSKYLIVYLLRTYLIFAVVSGSSPSQSSLKEEGPSVTCVFHARGFEGEEEKWDSDILGVHHHHPTGGVYRRCSK
jgi:hypothetical protein